MAQRHCFWLDDKEIQPYEKIEIVITHVCGFHGVKWQDVIREKKRSGTELMHIKQIIAHLIHIHTNHEIASEVTGYGRPYLYKCADRYHERRKKYLELSRVISNKINQTYQPKAA